MEGWAKRWRASRRHGQKVTRRSFVVFWRAAAGQRERARLLARHGWRRRAGISELGEQCYAPLRARWWNRDGLATWRENA